MLFRVSLISNQIVPEKANELYLLLLLNLLISYSELKKEVGDDKMIFILKSQLILFHEGQFKIKIKFHKINTLKQL